VRKVLPLSLRGQLLERGSAMAATTTPTPTAPPVAPSRLGRIVVRRAGALGAVATPAPARCAEDRREEPARAADLVWRLPGAAPLAAGC
jgi:hypothetical protein